MVNQPRIRPQVDYHILTFFQTIKQVLLCLAFQRAIFPIFYSGIQVTSQILHTHPYLLHSSFPI